MAPSTRKALGCVILLVYLGLYAAAAATLGAVLASSLPAWAHLVYFAIAGLVWVIPLRPMFAWMNGQARRD